MNETGHNETAAAEPSFFGLALSTHRVLMKQAGLPTTADVASDEIVGLSSAFPYEAAIAAISIGFFRSTVRWNKEEPAVLRWFFCLLLAALAFTQRSYELLVAVEIFSYVVSWLILRPPLVLPFGPAARAATSSSPEQQLMIRLLSIALGAIGSMLLSHATFGSGVLLRLVKLLTPRIVVQTLEYLFPISEMTAAYNIMHSLAMEPDVYKQMIEHLFFVTFHIQVGMGYLGIDFLRNEQSRRNMLIRLDVDGDEAQDKNSSTTTSNRNGDHPQQKKDLTGRARSFQRSAAPFIFRVALPYMMQIILYGNINKFAFSCVHDELHRTVRFRQVFEHDNHLTAMATDSPTSPEGMLCSVFAIYVLVNKR